MSVNFIRKNNKNVFNTIVLSCLYIFSALVLNACSRTDCSFDDFLSEKRASEISLKYAEKFKIAVYDDFTLVSIMSFKDDSPCYKYVLSGNEEYLSSLENIYKAEEISFINTPVKNIISLSSQNIAFLDALNLLDAVKGIDLRRNISNIYIQKKIEDGQIIETGEGREIDLEKSGMINPDLILSSGTGGEYDAGNFFKDNIVLTYEWLEKTPLARAEWIKCIALFCESYSKAEKVFNNIEDNYISLKNRASQSESSFSVLPNMVYGDSWAVPGGRSFAAAFYKDANIDYPWSYDNSEGSLFLDFEAVLAKASEADIWLINSININSTEDILKSDSRYRLFSAIQTGNVYNNNRGTGKYGNPYWEEGILYPDRILSDLIKIFHPEVENSNPFYFYKKLPGKS